MSVVILTSCLIARDLVHQQDGAVPYNAQLHDAVGHVDMRGTYVWRFASDGPCPEQGRSFWSHAIV